MEEINKVTSEYGNNLSSFEIIGELGRGSYGLVLKVRSRKDHRIYALKRLPIKFMKIKHQQEALQEVLLLKQLSHPNIIRYYSSFIESEALYILMEYAAKGDLHKIIREKQKSGKYFNENDIWKYAYGIMSGLIYLHSHKIIHRDIKCLNILLSESMVAKVYFTISRLEV